MELLCIENDEIYKNILKIVEKKMCPYGCTMPTNKVGSEGRQLFGKKLGLGRVSQGHFCKILKFVIGHVIKIKVIKLIKTQYYNVIYII